MCGTSKSPSPKLNLHSGKVLWYRRSGNQPLIPAALFFHVLLPECSGANKSIFAFSNLISPGLPTTLAVGLAASKILTQTRGKEQNCLFGVLEGEARRKPPWLVLLARYSSQQSHLDWSMTCPRPTARIAKKLRNAIRTHPIDTWSKFEQLTQKRIQSHPGLSSVEGMCCGFKGKLKGNIFLFLAGSPKETCPPRWTRSSKWVPIACKGQSRVASERNPFDRNHLGSPKSRLAPTERLTIPGNVN